MELAPLLRAVYDAGDAIRACEERDDCDPRAKADGSLLTAADLAAHRILRDALQSLDARVPIVSEEDREPAVCAAPRFWLVDPLDGTREFVAGNGQYTVNVALVENGESVLGVVHAPALGVTYAAVRGRGATRLDAAGERAIRVASHVEPLVVVASRSHAGEQLGVFLGRLPPHEVVGIGSSLKICLVADGTAHLYPRLGPTMWWDTAAAHAIAREAGAALTTLAGDELRYDGASLRNPSFVCSAVPRALWSGAAALCASA